MKSILHIGMGKCMSTSLQAYLRQAKNVFFMGIGPSKFVEPDVLLAFQRQIVRTPTLFYNRDFVAGVFDKCLSRATEMGAGLFALSDETIPFPIGYGRSDTSYYERLLRLKEMMPTDTTVLMIVRRPEDYLKSVYKYRTIINGMTVSFEDYLRRLILLEDTYFLSTVKYFAYAEAARHIFGSVRIVAMEEIEENPDCLLSLLRQMGADGADRLPYENAGMATDKFENFRSLYAPFGDTLADDDFNVMSPADRLVCQSNLPYFGSVFAAALAKEQTLQSLRNLATQLPSRPPTSFALSDETRKFLTGYVVESNAGLKARYGIDVDEYEYGAF